MLEARVGAALDGQPLQRVAHAHLHTDHLVQRSAETLELRRPARDHDLADAERLRLGLVELQRADELAGERRQPQPDRLQRTISRLFVDPLDTAR